ncbi:hypothetical protein NUKP24_33170 [Klebsiella variicola]|nr:hypothetical protein NUKP24_33170 [Klebsiella variicola]
MVMSLFHSVSDLIGHTPLLQLHKLDTGPCSLFLKLENQNPGGSIKDRVALSMINEAERQGKLAPGGTIIEATAGNTGLGLALIAAQKNYRLILVVPDKMSREKIFHLRALGATVLLTRSDVNKGHPAYYQDYARRLADETPGAFYIDQFNNDANPLAHATSTAPELYQQLEGDIDAVVVGVGSGGTLGGLQAWFAEHSPKTEFILADPAGSILADQVDTGRYGETGSWLVEGIGEDFIPPLARLEGVHTAYRVSDREAFQTARQLLQIEGVLAGSSTGTLLSAALRYCRAQSRPKRVVTFACDSGNKYLSKMFNDDWMRQQGLIARPEQGDLSDFIALRHDEGATVTAAPDDTLAAVFTRMRLYDISQLPVLEDGHVVGIVDEWDLIRHVQGDRQRFSLPVSEAMSRHVETLDKRAPESELQAILDRGLVAVIADNARRHNLISVADNTFASPAIHRPLEHGFDIVVHSATKYLNGHSDVVAGLAVVGDNSELAEKLGYLQNAVGGVLDPFSSFLTLRGIRTLALRMERHSANALQLAEWLEQQPEVERVWFPWLASHPHHQLARQQMALPGGMISVVVKGDEGYAERIISKLRWFTLAESLGGVESLVSQPFSMTHASIPLEKRLANGITPQLIRLSVGIEDPNDLIADWQQALREE